MTILTLIGAMNGCGLKVAGSNEVKNQTDNSANVSLTPDETPNRNGEQTDRRAEKAGSLDGKTAKTPNDYGKTVKFAPAQELEFADFTLEFNNAATILTGKPVPKEKLPTYYFRVSRGGDSIIVWGNDAKNVTPLEFQFRGAKYKLESGISDASGKLAGDELIVRKMN